jgi:hypothetical protein
MDYEPMPHVPTVSEVKQIIISGSAEDLTQAIRSLDSYLVPNGEGVYGEGDLEKEVADFLQCIKKYGRGNLKIYLRDGGISRLLICVDDVKNDKFIIEVSEYNSSPKVVKNWKQLNQ